MMIFSWRSKMHRSFLTLLAMLSLSHWHKRPFVPISKMAQQFVVKQTSTHETKNIQNHSRPLGVCALYQKMRRPVHKQSALFAGPISLSLAQEISILAYCLTCLCQTLPVPCASQKPKKSIFAT